MKNIDQSNSDPSASPQDGRAVIKTDPTVFKAYDIRGVYPEQINGDLVYKIAQAYAKFITLTPTLSQGGRENCTVVVGTDMRLCGQEFKDAATKGLTDAGVNVIDIGLVSTDQLYFAVVHLKADGGIMATASHNPKEFGGLKLVREQSKPISGDSGIYQIRDMVVSGQFVSRSANQHGAIFGHDISQAYFEHVLKTFNIYKIKPLKVVANTNFGMAGVAVKRLKDILPVKFIEVLNGELDGNFPKGRPDPLRPENRDETIASIKNLKPDLGVAWDADADRCFFFDELGNFITPAYINALLSEYYLQKNPGAKILYDTRVVRVIEHVVAENGGVGIMTKAGHSFIKERMMLEQAVFGSETSGHYYFKDNFYLDNGLFPFMAVLDILSSSDKTFSEILKPLREKFYISEEINFEVNQPDKTISELKQAYSDAKIGEIDGLDFNYPNWRFNVRKSNTENLLRINLEANNEQLLKEKTDAVSSLINKSK